jgi:NitT/TauT family transport system ATP-binding protein
MEPAVLLMDEPFAALDALTRDDMQRLLADVWRETRKTVVYVTHNVAEAVYLADRVLVLSGRPATIRKSVRVALPREREMEDPRLIELQRLVLECLLGSQSAPFIRQADDDGTASPHVH